jgi:hypothetical protein
VLPQAPSPRGKVCAYGGKQPYKLKFETGGLFMDFDKVPIRFGMALAMNEPAMNAYSAMTEEQKQEILNRAHNARSEREMHTLVASIVKH